MPTAPKRRGGSPAEIAEALGHVGVLCVEMFERERAEQPALLVNEIAPRVHNSGHWTIDACAVSQFENHVRAIAGWPLGDTERHSDAVMTNLIGEEAGPLARACRRAKASALHLYGKREARPGRKMGHTTAAFAEELMTRTLWTIRGAFVRALPDAGLAGSGRAWFGHPPHSSTLEWR